MLAATGQGQWCGLRLQICQGDLEALPSSQPSRSDRKKVVGSGEKALQHLRGGGAGPGGTGSSESQCSGFSRHPRGRRLAWE